MGDVSKKLMNQFATNLNTMLDQQPPDGHARAPSRVPTAPPTASPRRRPSERRAMAPP